MRKDWKYILYLTLAFGLFVIVQLTGSKQFNWTPTYASDDKNPFGAYVLHELLPSAFAPHGIRMSNKTIYELKDSVRKDENLLILTHNFTGDAEDTRALLNLASAGSHILISAQSFSGKFADTLKLETQDNYFNAADGSPDSTYLSFVNPREKGTSYFFRKENIYKYFSKFDSTRTTIMAENAWQQPVMIRIKYGNGNFILSSTPLAFTNIYALHNQHASFLDHTFSYLPRKPLYWSEYYSLGRREAMSPLRYILKEEPLSWAYYITVISLLLFMAFESKRRQRIIPVIEPVSNTTLEFIGTIGNLYFSTGDDKNIAEKKILYFFEQIRSKYGVRVQPGDEQFIYRLAIKTGRDEQKIRSLTDLINRIRMKPVIEREELIELNTRIEDFNAVKP